MAIAVFMLYLVIAGASILLAIRLFHFTKEHPAKALVFALIAVVCLSFAADMTKGVSQTVRKTTASLTAKLAH
jgi:hypothetical protein